MAAREEVKQGYTSATSPAGANAQLNEKKTGVPCIPCQPVPSNNYVNPRPVYPVQPAQPYVQPAQPVFPVQPTPQVAPKSVKR